mgnify:CR=1 FL=1
MKIKDITLIAIMLAVLIVCSQLSIPIGPVPITLQTLAVLLIGYLLTPKNALFVTILYALTGLLGLPFFSGFSGGLQSAFLPSFGFILAFIPAAYIQAKYLATKGTDNSKTLILSGLQNIFITYLIGLPYMAFILNRVMGFGMNFSAILIAGFIPFIPGDIAKLFISFLIAKRLIPILQTRSTLE